MLRLRSLWFKQGFILLTIVTELLNKRICKSVGHNPDLLLIYTCNKQDFINLFVYKLLQCFVYKNKD